MKIKSCLLAAALCLITACTPSEPLPQGLEISNATVKAPLKGRTMTAGYLEIKNQSEIDDALIGVESDKAERIEMHSMEMVHNVSKMRRQVSFDIPAGETLVLAPGGNHLMIFGVELTDDVDDMALTLKFKHSDDLTIIADIVDGAAHMGH